MLLNDARYMKYHRFHNNCCYVVVAVAVIDAIFDVNAMEPKIVEDALCSSWATKCGVGAGCS